MCYDMVYPLFGPRNGHLWPLLAGFYIASNVHMVGELFTQALTKPNPVISCFLNDNFVIQMICEKICISDMSRQGSRPTRPKTHDECRLESCCCCGGKVKPESGRSKITPVSVKMVQRIQKWAKPEFNVEVLMVIVKTGVKEKWDQFRLQDIHIPRGQETETCRCDICTARRTNGIGRKV